MTKKEKAIFDLVFYPKKKNTITMDEIEKNESYISILKFYKSLKREIENSIEFEEGSKLNKSIPDYKSEP